jgi:crossover junction endodeoxyribonuclease RusA
MKSDQVKWRKVRGKPVLVKFTVYAKPEPQGSSRAFIPRGWKRPIVTSDNKDLKSYRQQVSIEAMSMMREHGLEPIPPKQAVSLTLRFFFKRPKSKSKKATPTVRPDIDKVCRSVGDALSGICYQDDSQITRLVAEKFYDQPERTEIEVG